MPYKDPEQARANRRARRGRMNARRDERMANDPKFGEAVRASGRAWGARNREKVKAKNAAYRNGPKREELLAKKRAYSAANQEKISERRKEWMQELPPLALELKRKKCREWHLVNKPPSVRAAEYAASPALREQARQSSKAQKARLKQARHAKLPASCVCWQCGEVYAPRQPRQQCCTTRCATRLNMAIQNQKRRAFLAGQQNNVTPQDWRDIMRYFDWRCAYCDRRGVRLTMDHVQPLSRQGLHAQLNIVPACGRCNCSKNDSNLIEFMLLRRLPRSA